MKANALLAAAALLAVNLMGVTSPAWSQTKSAKDEVLATEKGLAAATTADELAPYYAQDIELYDMITPGVFHGWKAVHDDFAAQFAQVRNVKVEIVRIDIGVSGNMAYAYSTQRFTFDQPNNGPHGEIDFRQTDILKKVKGHWVVKHQHLSVPFDPATGKAQMVPAAAAAPAKS